MIRPPRGDCVFMMRNACCAQRNDPVRLISTTLFHCSKGSSSRSTPGAPMPALLNSKSSRPKIFSTSPNSAFTESGSATSVGIVIALRPEAPPSLATASSGSLRRPASATFHPAFIKARAEALPTPVPPPVTTAILAPLMRSSDLRSSIYSRSRRDRTGSNLNRLIVLHAPRLREDVTIPGLPSGKRLHSRHINACCVAHRQIICVETIDHRRKHRVRSAELAKQKRACAAETPTGPAEGFVYALDVGERFFTHPDGAAWTPDVHGALGAQCHEARMHLGRQRARVRPRVSSTRPDRKDRISLGKIFNNGEGVPHADAAVTQRRTFPSRRMCEHFGARFRPPHRDHDVLEGNIEMFQNHPRPHRPGRICLVGENERKGHWLSCLWRLRLQLFDRTARLAPRFKAAFDMGDGRQAHVLCGLRGKRRAPTTRAEEDEALVFGEDRLVIRALRIYPEFKHAARDVERARDYALALSLARIA